MTFNNIITMHAQLTLSQAHANNSYTSVPPWLQPGLWIQSAALQSQSAFAVVWLLLVKSTLAATLRLCCRHAFFRSSIWTVCLHNFMPLPCFCMTYRLTNLSSFLKRDALLVSRCLICHGAWLCCAWSVTQVFSHANFYHVNNLHAAACAFCMGRCVSNQRTKLTTMYHMWGSLRLAPIMLVCTSTSNNLSRLKVNLQNVAYD